LYAVWAKSLEIHLWGIVLLWTATCKTNGHGPAVNTMHANVSYTNGMCTSVSVARCWQRGATTHENHTKMQNVKKCKICANARKLWKTQSLKAKNPAV
jgi:hypothetical protein